MTTGFEDFNLFSEFPLENLQDPWTNTPTALNISTGEPSNPSAIDANAFAALSYENWDFCSSPDLFPLSPASTAGQSYTHLGADFSRHTSDLYANFCLPTELSNLSPSTLPISATTTASPQVKFEYPSPLASPLAQESPLSSSFTDTEDISPLSMSQPKSVPPRRRGPGRPSKAQLAAEGLEGGRRPSGRTLVTARRQVHNDSAMRSRAKFNCVLDELWNEIPEAERQKATMGMDPSRQVPRAERVEIVIIYLRKLQRMVKSV